MKFISSIFILLFISFQFSTSIVYFVGNCNDASIAIYNQEEEEENSKESKESKELKSEFSSSKNSIFSFATNFKSTKIVTLYLINKYQVSTTITILPPENI